MPVKILQELDANFFETSDKFKLPCTATSEENMENDQNIMAAFTVQSRIAVINAQNEDTPTPPLIPKKLLIASNSREQPNKRKPTILPKPRVSLRPFKRPVAAVRPLVGIFPKRRSSKERNFILPPALPPKKNRPLPAKREVHIQRTPNGPERHTPVKAKKPPIPLPRQVKSPAREETINPLVKVVVSRSESNISTTSTTSSTTTNSDREWTTEDTDDTVRSVSLRVLQHAMRHSRKRSSHLHKGKRKTELQQKRRSNSRQEESQKIEKEVIAGDDSVDIDDIYHDVDVVHEILRSHPNLVTTKSIKNISPINSQTTTETTTTTKETKMVTTTTVLTTPGQLHEPTAPVAMDNEDSDDYDSDDYEDVEDFPHGTEMNLPFTKPEQELILADGFSEYENTKFGITPPPRPPKTYVKPPEKILVTTDSDSSRDSASSDDSYISPDDFQSGAVKIFNFPPEMDDCIKRPMYLEPINDSPYAECQFSEGAIHKTCTPEMSDDGVFTEHLPAAPPRNSSLAVSPCAGSSDASHAWRYMGNPKSAVHGVSHLHIPGNQVTGSCPLQRGRKKSRFEASAPMFQTYQADKLREEMMKLRDTKKDEELSGSVKTIRKFQRTLWSELPEVRRSGVLGTLDAHEMKLQESMFEVISSEASYLRSLNVFVDHFLANISILKRFEHQRIFSNILDVRNYSEKFLLELEARQVKSIMMFDLCDIISRYSKECLKCYVVYCSNHAHQLKTLTELRDKNPEFCTLVKSLERNPVCEHQTFQSFLTLPMQRITRIPLLVQNIFHRTKEDTEPYISAKSAYHIVRKVVQQCNDGARKMDRLYEMVAIQRQLKMDMHLALVSASRWLVKRGALTEIQFAKSKLPFRSNLKLVQTPIYLFLLTDVLLVTKKKKVPTATLR